MRFRFPGRLLALMVFFTATASAQTEYQIKAAFIYNFVRFVEWPAQSLKNPGDPIGICVLGPNAFRKALEDSVTGKVVEGRALTVRPFPIADPAGQCQILFVGREQRKQFRSSFPALKGGGILMIGESPDFLADGGVINFKLETGHLRFEINPNAADRENLRISSKLLSLAGIVPK